MTHATSLSEPAVVVVRFDLPMSSAEYRVLAMRVAPSIASQPGLRLKLWALDEAERTAENHYIFDSLQAAREYLAGPAIGELRQLLGREPDVRMLRPLVGPSLLTGAARHFAPKTEERHHAGT